MTEPVFSKIRFTVSIQSITLSSKDSVKVPMEKQKALQVPCLDT
jgi:hypothetical protein